GRPGVRARGRVDGDRARLHPPGPVVCATGGRRLMIVSHRQVITGTALLLVLIAVTLIPFASLFTTALHQSGTYPSGLDWPSHPHWHNFVEAFHVANMGAIFKSSVLIVLGVVPISCAIAT